MYDYSRGKKEKKMAMASDARGCGAVFGARPSYAQNGA